MEGPRAGSRRGALPCGGGGVMCCRKSSAAEGCCSPDGGRCSASSSSPACAPVQAVGSAAGERRSGRPAKAAAAQRVCGRSGSVRAAKGGRGMATGAGRTETRASCFGWERPTCSAAQHANFARSAQPLRLFRAGSKGWRLLWRVRLAPCHRGWVAGRAGQARAGRQGPEEAPAPGFYTPHCRWAA